MAPWTRNPQVQGRSTVADHAPLIAHQLEDLNWFERVAAHSELYLRGVPDSDLSTWFAQQYAPERQKGARNP